MGDRQYNGELFSQLIYLIACALHQQKAELPETADLKALYGIAKMHSLTAMTAMALEETEVFRQADPEVQKKWTDAKNRSVRASMLRGEEIRNICRKLEEERIWYMLLKGNVIKNYYPKYGMRQMADCDILFDAKYQKKVKQIFTERGYKTESYDKWNHDVYQKPPIYNFEMHTMLFNWNCGEEWVEKYRTIKEKLLPAENSEYEYVFRPEDLYVYLTAHAHKHFSGEGTGLRTVVDTYVALHSCCSLTDRAYVECELSELGLIEFEKGLRELSEALFSEPKLSCLADLSESVLKMLNDCVISGTYGNVHVQVNRSMDALQKDGGEISGWTKIRYMFSRIFPGLAWCRYSAPTVYRYPVLLPFLWIYRILRVAVRRKKIWNEFKEMIYAKR